MNIFKNIFKFYNQVQQEARKITWPSKNESLTSTWIVILVVFIFSLICMGVDFALRNAVQFLLNL